ncbi:Ubiquitin carboxyl-terminal hydrolase [Trichinella spiralis]|uniref:Ubiquitin carboxyl-terminal hydrolase 14 n=1 Tax=Trichinella spiralis TaxID=6334 RepID=A0ABR3KZC6_TRISP
MSSLRVNVKWGKEKFENVEVDLSASPVQFRAQLFTLTGVPPTRQKILCRGKNLRPDTWDEFPVQEGSLIMLLGTAEELVEPPAPTEQPTFLEDMTPDQISAVICSKSGLKNLGNTCYMNATLHPSVHQGKYVTSCIQQQFKLMNQPDLTESVPVMLLNAIHMTMPQFATKGEDGRLMQQDANELWLELLRRLKSLLPGTLLGVPDAKQSVVEMIFGGRYKIITKRVDECDEPPVETSEDFLQLSCFLSSGVRYLFSGLKAKMTEEITKYSDKLGCDAVYQRKSEISRLPGYLTIQIVRFYYKEREKMNAKILKDVKFPIELDVYDLCCDELKEKLLPMRAKLKLMEEKLLETAYQKSRKTQIPGDELKAEEVAVLDEEIPFSFPDDPGSNNSGLYRLRAVLTHKGRSSSSGHYVAWVLSDRGQWVKCDDDIIELVTEEEILRLSGGGDWHCAYLLLYGPKDGTTGYLHHMEEIE